MEKPSKVDEGPFIPEPIPVIQKVQIFVTHELSTTGRSVGYYVDPDLSVNDFISTLVKEDPLENRLHVLEPDPKDAKSYTRGTRFLPNSERMRKTIRELEWKNGIRVLIEKNVAPLQRQKMSGYGLRGEHYEMISLLHHLHIQVERSI